MSETPLSEPGPADRDRPNRVPWPPIIYLVALAAALVLDQLLPFWPLSEEGQRLIGGGLMVAGFAIAIAGFFYFQMIGTPFDPTAGAKSLATGGIYGWTRNPMYLGACIFYAGLALVMRSGWLLLGVPVIAYALQALAIEPEEAYLTRRFGEAYRAYCARVRRWV